MAGGGFKAPLFTVAWPTGEFGAMGLEGAVRLGMRRELEAIEDEEERERVFEATVAAAYERGRGVNMAAYGEIDDVIDPADSRRWIATLFDGPGGWRRRRQEAAERGRVVSVLRPIAGDSEGAPRRRRRLVAPVVPSISVPSLQPAAEAEETAATITTETTRIRTRLCDHDHTRGTRAFVIGGRLYHRVQAVTGDSRDGPEALADI